MTHRALAISTSVLTGARALSSASDLLRAAERLDVRDISLHRTPKEAAPVMRASAASHGLTLHGLSVSLATAHNSTQRRRVLLDAQRWGGEAGVARLVLDVGDVGTKLDREARRALPSHGGVPDHDESATSVWGRYSRLRDDQREDAVETWARQLHPFHHAGTPLAIRSAADGVGLLGLEEAGWLLDELPTATLWLDAGRARATGDTLATWLDAFASRVSALVVSSRDGSDPHPEALGIDWRGVASNLPGRAVWVLAMGGNPSDDAISDALDYLGSKVNV